MEYYYTLETKIYLVIIFIVVLGIIGSIIYFLILYYPEIKNTNSNSQPLPVATYLK